LHRKYCALDIHAENPVEGRLRDFPEWFQLAQACVGEQDIDASSI
jgi:hypothetical protein